MKKITDMNIGELAAYVCDHLMKNGMKVTLSGGACVSIYSENRYQSFDLDFIEYFIEFPPGPLALGDEPVKHVEYIELKPERYNYYRQPIA